ncbi:MAG TPA: adenylate/guanylate cyclase domain-containing protein [Anaerolineales bacterium]
MWTLTVRSLDIKPIEYLLKPGVNSLGRRQGNDVVIADEAASRDHAQIHLDAKSNAVTIRDLGSRNGTFINRRRLTENFNFKLHPNDVVRIGTYEILVVVQAEADAEEAAASAFRPFTRELVLESFDNHAVLLYEVIQQLNNILDVDVALKEVARLLQLTLGADKCQVILAEDFGRLQELGFPRTIAQTAINRRTTVLLPSKDPESRQMLSDSARMLRVNTALCVPVVRSDQTIALIYMFKTHADTRQFTQGDMQLAVAVGHLAALTIERVNLMERVREENRVRQLLQRFVAPGEAEFLLRNYLKTGSLPTLSEQNCTILFADIAGSNGMAERLGAKRFGELLERYYQDVTDIIFQHGGLLDKYLGDGVMAIFGMADTQKQPAGRAVAAGLDIARMMAAPSRNGDTRVDVGIGVNTGPVMAGYVSTKERVELTVLGDTVNVASGLQALARPNRVLIGPETYAEVKNAFAVESVGERNIKDRSQPIEVYEVFQARPI